MSSTQLAAFAAAALLLAPAPPFAGDIVGDAEQAWSRLEDVTLDADPFRDKKRMCTDLSAYGRDGELSPKEARKAAKGLGRLLKRDSPGGLVWRVQELRGRLLAEVDPTDADEAFTAALAAYPDEDYGQPSMHGYFHHLLMDAVVQKARARGFDAADELLLGTAKEDPRLRAWYPSKMEAHYLLAGERARLLKVYEAMAVSLEERAPELAKEIAFGSLPDVRVLKDHKKKAFLVLGADHAADGERDLLVVMPGGTGQAFDFRSWVTDLTEALHDRYVVAILNAPQWNPAQAKEWVWVTEGVQRKYRADFCVEDFAREVAAELRADEELKIDEAFLFAWSSGGPAAYATVLSKDDTFAGAYVLASVFKPRQLDVKHAEGKRFVLEQGVTDKVTPIRFAREAQKALEKNGAEVRFVEFQGGHGFAMPDPAKSLREALDWLSR